jgi:sulfatase modifying factor 1
MSIIDWLFGKQKEQEPAVTNAAVEGQAKATEPLISKPAPYEELEKDVYKGNMILVEGGSFRMGSEDGESNECPVHDVTLDSFYIGKYPVTQSEWQVIMGQNPSNFGGPLITGTIVPLRPVEEVSWFECIEFCNRKSLKESLSPCYQIQKDAANPNDTDKWSIKCDWEANGYRLPTEAEWEFAARGGMKSKGFKYSGSNIRDEVAWHGTNTCYTQPVGRKKSNELGIHDMGGNVAGWCWDWYDKNYYGISSTNNPRGPDNGKHRIHRGWGWVDYGHADYVRNTFRGSGRPDYVCNQIGLRIVKRV